MKSLVKLFSVLGLLTMIGCSSNSNELRPLNGGVCNNPNCKCAKPCPCGASCQCGQNGNSKNMGNDTK
ncbi:hypothetical protein [Sulfurimonas sp. C5]|uniref:hypothetical protein n=1 Tax=Sulfurimonas sp. C5 TaxID=3036947 RepID=UPI00245743D6|nr:hypothetical protein [Sulfurimonas sp. C5]MDH4944094.1 hypothetical protein [Sulfurimonas sp. C5]